MKKLKKFLREIWGITIRDPRYWPQYGGYTPSKSVDQRKPPPKGKAPEA